MSPISLTQARATLYSVLMPSRLSGLGRLTALAYMLAAAAPGRVSLYPVLVIHAAAPGCGRALLANYVGACTAPTTYADGLYNYIEDAHPHALSGVCNTVHGRPFIVTTLSEHVTAPQHSTGCAELLRLDGPPLRYIPLIEPGDLRAACSRLWQQFDEAGCPFRLDPKPAPQHLGPYRRAWLCAYYTLKHH